MTPSARIAMVLAASISAVLAPTAATAATAATAGTAVPAAAAVPAPGSLTAAFTVAADWPAGYIGNITIRNGTATPVNGWRVEFDLAADTRVISSWGGSFTRAGDNYTVTNAAWNGSIAPGASVTFGWAAEGRTTPLRCTLNGGSCAGVSADYTAPTRPGPLAFGYTPGLTITWAPSTDDQGPVTYEVYDGSQLLGRVTEPRYVVFTGPFLPPKVYIFSVRAVDAAGNQSAGSFRTLGTIWRGDETPAPPSGLRVDTPATGLLRLTWSGAPIPPQFNVPPIAGYEVYLDGEVVGQVGRTSIVVPQPEAGPHTFGVRTINAVDRYSPVVELEYVGD